MGLLRLASDATVDLSISPDGDFITVREELSKAVRNGLMKKMPSRPDLKDTGFTVTEGLDFQTALFEALVVAWSGDFLPTVENYLKLPTDAADAIDMALAKHFESMTPTTEEAKKA